jgi:hypothetical protein
MRESFEIMRGGMNRAEVEAILRPPVDNTRGPVEWDIVS